MGQISRSLTLGLATTSIAMIAVSLTVGLASAHEKRTVGVYTLLVGFLNEPAIVEQPNGIDLRVQQADDDTVKPLSGLAGTLKADVEFGNQTKTLGLEESDENPGEYIASFIPTAEGPYTFHIYGTIEGTIVDESFTSGPQTFDEVESGSSLQFPATLPAVGEVSQTASSARDAASGARILGIIGIIVGAVGLTAGIAGMLMARKTQLALSDTRDSDVMRETDSRRVQG